MEPEPIERPLLLSEIIRPVIADVGLFIEELSALQGHLAAVAEPLRETMRPLIMRTRGAVQAEPIHAVDAASIPINRQGLALVVAAGVCYGAADQVRVEFARRSGENTEDFRRVATALRLMLEFRLLSEADCLTIVDNSFWSLLMDSNQIMTLWRDLDSEELRTAFEEPVTECYGREGTFIQVLRNEHLIALSKTASSDRISTLHHIKPPIGDRTLMTAVLQPDEYLRPVLLKEIGQFGIERGISDHAEIERIFRRRLWVTFYRPWEFQRAYRIEFHANDFPEGAWLESLFARVKHETRERTIMEPISQYLADMVSKQISAAGPLYIEAALHRFPSLMGPYRTGG